MMTNEERPINIFVPNYVDKNDYSEAEKLGEMVYMTKGVNVYTIEQLHNKFATYFKMAKDGDILLLSGSNVVCATAYAEWCNRFPTSRKLLTFDRRFGYTLSELGE